MFGLFKSDPVGKLEKEYKQLLEQGVAAQRKGDIRTYSELTEQADKVLKEIEKLKA